MHVGERARESEERVFWRGIAMLILNREGGGKGRERGDRATNRIYELSFVIYILYIQTISARYRGACQHFLMRSAHRKQNISTWFLWDRRSGHREGGAPGPALEFGNELHVGKELRSFLLPGQAHR
jgi:hypothetical protein